MHGVTHPRLCHVSAYPLLLFQSLPAVRVQAVRAPRRSLGFGLPGMPRWRVSHAQVCPDVLGERLRNGLQGGQAKGEECVLVGGKRRNDSFVH